MLKIGAVFGFLLYVVIGFYFINFPFNYIEVSDLVSQFNQWIIFVGGILLFFGGINYVRASRKKITH